MKSILAPRLRQGMITCASQKRPRERSEAREAEVPGVGENLHDHPGVAVEYEPSQKAVSA